MLSAGHGCLLQYVCLHLAGFESVQVCKCSVVQFVNFSFAQFRGCHMFALSLENELCVKLNSVIALLVIHLAVGTCSDDDRELGLRS